MPSALREKVLLLVFFSLIVTESRNNQNEAQRGFSIRITPCQARLSELKTSFIVFTSARE